jgi:uncharacterized iron-regulated membrane protein
VNPLRKTLMVTHRWVALVVGIVLVFTAASGALLVFEGAIDRGLNPRLWRVSPRDVTLPIDSLVARVEATLSKAKVTSVGPSSAGDQAWTMSAGPLSVFVDPYTGEIKGTRTATESQATLARRLHVFHVELVAGRVGRSIVGAVTVVALFLVLTGIILWWPDKIFRIHTTASWKRINFDLHHALGIVAAIVLVVITSSALVIHYDALATSIRSLDGTAPPRAPAQPPGPADAPRLSFDSIASAARRALPGATVRNISMGGPKNPIAVGMRFPEDRTPGGRSRVFVNRYTGEVLSASSTRDARVGTRIDNLKRSLHTGDVFGKPSEAVWLLASLVMVEQAVTGALMWWNARRGRHRV